MCLSTKKMPSKISAHDAQEDVDFVTQTIDNSTSLCNLSYDLIKITVDFCDNLKTICALERVNKQLYNTINGNSFENNIWAHFFKEPLSCLFDAKSSLPVKRQVKNALNIAAKANFFKEITIAVMYVFFCKLLLTVLFKSGEGGVGKSALTIRLVQHCFVEEYDPTIMDSYNTSLLVDGIPTKILVLDTGTFSPLFSTNFQLFSSTFIYKAFQEEHAPPRKGFLRTADAIILVTDIIYGSRELQSYYDEVLRYKDLLTFPPLILAINKIDVMLKNSKNYTVEQVCKDLKWIKEENVSVIETSAKENIHVMETFQMACKKAKKYILEQYLETQKKAGIKNSHACCMQ